MQPYLDMADLLTKMAGGALRGAAAELISQVLSTRPRPLTITADNVSRLCFSGRFRCPLEWGMGRALERDAAEGRPRLNLTIVPNLLRIRSVLVPQ